MTSGSLGQRRRLGRLFRRPSGNSIIIALDHGLFMGSMAGIEPLDDEGSVNPGLRPPTSRTASCGRAKVTQERLHILRGGSRPPLVAVSGYGATDRLDSEAERG